MTSTLPDAAALAATVESLARRVHVLESTLAIRNLQHAYGYYLDKTLYSEVVELFAENCTIVFMNAVYRGKAGARRLYTGRFRSLFTDGRNGPMPGFLLDHPQMQDVVHVDEDGLHASGRFRTLMQAGVHDDAEDPRKGRGRAKQWWEGGMYENRYLLEDSVWKIEVLNYQPLWHGTFEDGWAHTPPAYIPSPSTLYPEDEFGCDEIVAEPRELWPNTDVVPFHYPHPVTGEPWK
jgi:hypothetical protein